MYYVSSSTFSGFYPTVERPKKLAKSGLVYLWSCSSPGRRRNSKYHAIHWRGPRSNYLEYNGIVFFTPQLALVQWEKSREISQLLYIYILTYLHVGSTLVQNDMKNVVEIIRKNKNKYVHFPQFNRRVSFTKFLHRCYIKMSPIYYVFFHPQLRSVIRNIENHFAI